MSNKELYTVWAQKQERLPVFMQPWWMDAVCAGKEWDVILVESKKSKTENGQATLSDESDSASDEHPSSTPSVSDEQTIKETGEVSKIEEETIVAAMPYLFRKKWWMRWILMPQQTQFGGLWLDERHEFTPEELTAVCEEAARQLEEKKLHYYYQQFPVGSPCPEIFKSLGFKVKERITYRLNDLSNLDNIIDNFSRNKKRQLQKALALHVSNDLTAEEFYAFHQNSLAQQRKKISYSREFFLVLERKANRNGQSQIVAIRDADEHLRAAGFLVWDKEYAHYLIAAEDETQKNNGAMALLVLECIKLARKKDVAFDFEGSMIRGVAQHFKQFGSSPAKYYSVEKYYKWWFAILKFFYTLFRK